MISLGPCTTIEVLLHLHPLEGFCQNIEFQQRVPLIPPLPVTCPYSSLGMWQFVVQDHKYTLQVIVVSLHNERVYRWSQGGQSPTTVRYEVSSTVSLRMISKKSW